MSVTCSVIIVNYKVPELLSNCLKSVQAHTSISHEIIVVDNDSQDGSVEMLLTEFPHVITIDSGENLGFAAGNNLGLKEATGQYIFYLNPDTELKDNAIDRLCNLLSKNPDYGLVAPKLLNSDGSLQRSIRPFYTFWKSLFDNRYMPLIMAKYPQIGRLLPGILPHDEPREIDWAKGAALMVRKKIVDNIGAFDERFWIYGEEIDLCYRFHKHGWKIFYEPSIEIIHHESQSIGRKNTKMEFQNDLSLLLFLDKHYPNWAVKLYEWRMTLFAIIGMLFRSFKGWFSSGKQHHMSLGQIMERKKQLSEQRKIIANKYNK